MSDDSAAAQPAATPRVAAFFDLDKTVIAKSSLLAFSRPFFAEGLINRRAVLKSSYAQFVFMLSGAEADQIERMRQQLTALCTGWDVEQVSAIVEETLHDIVDPLVYSQAAERIATHRRSGHDVVIVSASGSELVTPIASMLGATYSVATRMVVADGRYTGEIEFYCYGANKAAAIEQISERHGYRLDDCYAYSDSATDLPMLEAVGLPHVVNPNRALRKIAEQRDWQVLTFSDAVSLRARATAPGPTVVAATAVGIGAVAGATWLSLRRRRQR